MIKRFFSILLLSAAIGMTSCQGGNNAPAGAAQTAVNEKLSVADFDQKLNATPGAVLVDVRTPAEYAEGHLKGAANTDFTAGDFEEKIGRLDKSKPVFIYCLSGGRSSSAAEKMKAMGFTAVYNMDGGIMKWRSANKPVEQGDAPAASGGLTMEAFNKLTASKKYVLVDFNATWCGPCKKMGPILDAVADKRKDSVALVKIDVDQNKDLAQQKAIDSIPYMELYKDGKLVWSHAGLMEESDLLNETKL